MHWKRVGWLGATVVALPLSPAAASPGGPETILSSGTFAAFEAEGNGMSCGTGTNISCTHTWDATDCFEEAGDSGLGGLGCDLSGSGKSGGTAARTRDGYVVCTTATLNTTHSASVVVTSIFFGSVDVPVEIAQSSGIGTFRGSRALLDRTVTVEGAFETPGADPQWCGKAAQGSVEGTFTITTP